MEWISKKMLFLAARLRPDNGREARLRKQFEWVTTILQLNRDAWTPDLTRMKMRMN